MTERATVFELAQIGLEATPGEGSAADRVLAGVGWLPTKQGKVDAFRPEGMKFGTVASVGKLHAEWKLEGILDYVNFLYLLRSLLYMEADPELVEDATNAYDWTFGSQPAAPDNGITFFVERGSSVKASTYAYCQITGLGFSFGAQDSTVKLTGAAISQKATRGQSLTASPDWIEAEPALPEHCTVKIGTTKGGGSALTRLFNLEWGFTGKYGPVFNIGAAASYVATVELAPDLNGSITVAADTVGETLEGHAEAATPLWIEIKFTGPEIETGFHYTITITMPIYLVTLGDASDVDGVWGLKFGLQGRYDTAEATALEVVVRSTDEADLHLPEEP